MTVPVEIDYSQCNRSDCVRADSLAMYQKYATARQVAWLHEVNELPLNQDSALLPVVVCDQHYLPNDQMTRNHESACATPDGACNCSAA